MEYRQVHFNTPKTNMRVVLSTYGRFHFFHLARQMEKRGWLEAIFSTHPRFKLKLERGIPQDKISSDWFLHSFLIAKNRRGFRWPRIDDLTNHAIVSRHDRYVTRNMPECDAFVALSGSGLGGGKLVQSRGGRYVCERSSSHVVYQNRLLVEEHACWGAAFHEIPRWVIDRELVEYETADRVVVPSSFAERSFLAEGFPAAKLVRNGFGAELTRFRKTGQPPDDAFVVLFVGQVCFRKGIPYLLEAFRQFKHPRKRLKIVGLVNPEIRPYLRDAPLDNVEFLGTVPNAELPSLFSSAHVFVLPSLEEGMAVVQAEALACGCPVIATEHTGAEDLFEAEREGFIVPIRDAEAIARRLEELADDPARRAAMSRAAERCIERIGGWDAYGARYAELLNQLRQ